MALRYWFRDPDGTLTEIVGRIDALSGDFSENAEEGSVGGSQVLIRDPDMDFTIGGHRIFAVQETSIVDTDNDFIYVAYTAARKIVRDEDGRGRNWEVQLVDVNSVLPRRLMTQAAANRPAETDVARVTWWEGTSDGSIIDDARYLLAADPVTMDAADYRDQYGFDILRDAAEHTGKNFFVTYFGDIDLGAAYPWGALSLWYGDPGETDYASTFQLTNVAADADSNTLIVVSAETNLDPHRVFSGVSLAYKRGRVFVEREQTATDFALGGRETVMPAVNVSSKTQALVRANRYLRDAAEEDERITVVYRVPRSDVNGIRPGMRVEAKFLHIPSVAAAYTWCRVLNRRITEPNLEQFEVTVELSPPSTAITAATCPDPTSTGSFYALGGGGNVPNVSTTGNVLYLKPGISGPQVITPNHQGSWHFPVYGAGGVGTTDYAGDCTQNHVRCMVVGEGTMVIHTDQYGGSGRSLTATLQHGTPTEPYGVTTDEVQTGTTGDDFTFTISTHGGVNCTHWVDVKDTGSVCGGKFGFSGFDWTAS